MNFKSKLLKTKLLLLSTLFIISCSKDDPVECNLGYTGEDCQTEITPSSIKVKSITVNKFPATGSNGAGWDLLDGADIYLEFRYNNNVIHTSSQLYVNADPTSSYDFSPSINLRFDNPTDDYVVALFDNDELTNDDFISGISFTAWQEGQGFPETYVIDAGEGFACILTLEYDFN